MSEQQHDKLLDHEYDGIQEMDNPLPGWWLATFYGAIVFSFLYVGYYHMGSGPSLLDELQTDLDAVHATKAQTESTGPTEESLMAIFNDAGRKEAGKKQFIEKCASCHGVHGEGLIGPNLTDNFWIHGNATLVDIANVVANGVPDKGMPPWKSLLKEQELYSVVAYVKSLHGTKPANQKAPQGNEIK